MIFDYVVLNSFYYGEVKVASVEFLLINIF